MSDTTQESAASGIANVETELQRPAHDLQDLPRLLLTVEQAAAALALGRTAVYELIHSQRLGSVRIGGSRRVPRAALDAYVAQLCRDAGITTDVAPT